MTDVSKPVRSQKVFVLLPCVMELQHQYHRAVAFSKEATTNQRFTNDWRTRVQTYEQIIDLLGLPIIKIS